MIRSFLFFLLALLLPTLNAQDAGDYEFAGQFNRKIVRAMSDTTLIGKTADGEADAPWNAPVRPDGSAMIRHLLTSGELVYGHNPLTGDRQLTFNSTFPEGLDPQIGEYTLSIDRHRLQDGKGTPLTPGPLAQVMLGGELVSGNATEVLQYNLAAFIPLEEKPRQGVDGAVTFTASYVTGYEQAELRPADVGQRVTLGETSVELLYFGKDHAAFAVENANVNLAIAQYDAAGNRLDFTVRDNLQVAYARVAEPVYEVLIQRPDLSDVALERLLRSLDGQVHGDQTIRKLTLVKTFANTARIVVYNPVMSEPLEWTYKVAK